MLNKIFVENYNATLSAIRSNQDQLNSKISEIIRQVNISEQEFIGFVKLDRMYIWYAVKKLDRCGCKNLCETHRCSCKKITSLAPQPAKFATVIAITRGALLFSQFTSFI